MSFSTRGRQRGKTNNGQEILPLSKDTDQTHSITKLHGLNIFANTQPGFKG